MTDKKLEQCERCLEALCICHKTKPVKKAKVVKKEVEAVEVKPVVPVSIYTLMEDCDGCKTEGFVVQGVGVVVRTRCAEGISLELIPGVKLVGKQLVKV